MNVAETISRYLVGGIFYLFMFAGCSAASYAISVRYFSQLTTSVRLLAAAVAFYWIISVWFIATASVGGWTLPGSLALSLALLLLAGRFFTTSSRRKIALKDVKTARRALRLLAMPKILLMLSPLLLSIGIRFGRGLVAPPLAWDALTYHLLKAGRWVQTGGFARESAPYAAQYYDYFPSLGSVPWAWTMLASHSDELLVWTSLLVYLGTVLCCYAASRCLGCNRRLAALACAIVASSPAVVGFFTSCYVDTTGLAMLLCSAGLLVQLVRTGNIALGVFSAGAAALAAGTKHSFAPSCVIVASAAVIALPWKGRLGASVRGSFLLFLVSIPPMFEYFRAQFRFSNPVYPIGLHLPGNLRLVGNEGFMEALYGPTRGKSSYDPAEIENFVKTFLFGNLDSEHLNLTFWAPVVALCGLIALVRFWGSNRGLYLVAVTSVVIAAAAPVLSLLGPQAAHYRGLYALTMGRFFLPLYACLLIMLLRQQVPGYKLVAFGAFGVNLWYQLPWGYKSRDIVLFGIMLVVVLLGIVWPIVRLRGQQMSARIAGAICLAASLFLLAGVAVVRDRSRSFYYRNNIAYFDHYRLYPASVIADIWEYCDTLRGATIACTSGFAMNGQTWYRYPLMGKRLQNKIVYIPPTTDGSLESLLTDNPQLDPAKWIERLYAGGVHYLVMFFPQPAEAGWVDRLPQLFRLILVNQGDRGVMYELSPLVNKGGGEAGP